MHGQAYPERSEWDAHAAQGRDALATMDTRPFALRKAATPPRSMTQTDSAIPSQTRRDATRRNTQYERRDT